MNIDETRTFWKVASTFPADKEAVYPAHAAAHNFDEQGQPGKIVLEYGCGGGSDAISLARRGAVVKATDVVPENVATTLARQFTWQEAHHVFEGGLTVQQLPASAPLPFDDDRFDSVNCHGVLHHIPEPTMHEVIAGFHRVLKPGGVLYAMLYTEHLFNRCITTIEGLKRSGLSEDRAFSMVTDGGGIARAYTEAQGRALFKDHGFDVIKTVEYNDADFRVFWARKPAITEAPFSPEI